MDPYVIRKVIGANHFADLMDQGMDFVVLIMRIAQLLSRIKLFVIMAPAQINVIEQMVMLIAIVTLMVSTYVVYKMEISA